MKSQSTHVLAIVTSILCMLAAVLLLLLLGRPTQASIEDTPNNAVLQAPTESVTLSAVADAYISNRTPSDAVLNFGSDSSLSVELDKAGTEQRTLIRFDTSEIPAGSIINKATMRLYQIAADSDNEPWLIWGHPILEPWDELKVTWNTQPATGTIMTSANTPHVTDQYVEWDVTDVTRRWVNTPQETPNYGVELLATTTGSVYLRRYTSRENRANAPQLVIDYSPPPRVAPIPRDDELAVDVDNVCMPKEEYANAAVHRYNDAFGRISDIYLKHDGKYLYVCVEGVWGQMEQRFFAVNLDRNLGQEKVAQPEDVSLRARVIDGAVGSFRGTGDANNPWTAAENPRLGSQRRRRQQSRTGGSRIQDSAGIDDRGVRSTLWLGHLPSERGGKGRLLWLAHARKPHTACNLGDGTVGRS